MNGNIIGINIVWNEELGNDPSLEVFIKDGEFNHRKVIHTSKNFEYVVQDSVCGDMRLFYIRNPLKHDVWGASRSGHFNRELGLLGLDGWIDCDFKETQASNRLSYRGAIKASAVKHLIEARGAYLFHEIEDCRDSYHKDVRFIISASPDHLAKINGKVFSTKNELAKRI